MHYYISILGTKFSQIDFVLYIVMPSSIVLIILTYILFNIRLIALSFDYDLFMFHNLRTKTENKLKDIINKD